MKLVSIEDQVVANRYSEMGYCDISLDLDGGHVKQVKAIHISSNVT